MDRMRILRRVLELKFKTEVKKGKGTAMPISL
jgi:hypothetical protein